MKFATEVEADILEELRALAESEGRPLKSVVHEALANLIERRRRGQPRRHVSAAYGESLEAYGSVYRKLAQ